MKIKKVMAIFLCSVIFVFSFHINPINLDQKYTPLTHGTGNL
ncbi:hypothetical protein SAMN06272722_105336 [Paenibacillus sp. RU5A]|nr:hypothetical protein SAMN06272722_105336 [Paenibacillus sp. RU5A]SOC71125.1 hypothetical protein SAMN05880581_105334 [Paenibacillus sp. RU26A]SOC73626.1 hypothetical protein SAMN05880586_105335 [Paenibacillus sp. RU5M]